MPEAALAVYVVDLAYLLDVQGVGYREYAARVGRFVPGIGRI